MFDSCSHHSRTECFLLFVIRFVTPQFFCLFNFNKITNLTFRYANWNLLLLHIALKFWIFIWTSAFSTIARNYLTQRKLEINRCLCWFIDSNRCYASLMMSHFHSYFRSFHERGKIMAYEKYIHWCDSFLENFYVLLVTIFVFLSEKLMRMSWNDFLRLCLTFAIKSSSTYFTVK